MEFVRLPKKLTSRNGAKHLLIGEFFENIYIYDDNDDIVGDLKVTISWTKIKEIYDKIVENLAVDEQGA